MQFYCGTEQIKFGSNLLKKLEKKIEFFLNNLLGSNSHDNVLM